MELKPNMYVRLNCNYELGIGKTIREIDEDNFIKTKFKDDFECSVPMYMILKASYNIIDLIEPGDYVNELPVEAYYTRYDEEKDDYIKIGIVTLEDYWKGTFTSVEDIKSIVTKEQFSAMEYKLGDK